LHIKSISKLVLLFTAVSLLLLLVFFYAMERKTGNFLLKTGENGLVLYQNDKIIMEYEGVTVNDLPLRDIKELQKGIRVESIEEAERTVENYDG